LGIKRVLERLFKRRSSNVFSDPIEAVLARSEPSKWDKRFLEIAKLVSTWSKDPSTGVGAVYVSPERRLLSIGYNGFPRDMPDNDLFYHDRDEKLARTVHAEKNGIYNATENGVSLKGSTLYVYGCQVCHLCSLGVMQVGVKRVVVAYPRSKVKTEWQQSTERTRSYFRGAGIEYVETVIEGE